MNPESIALILIGALKPIGLSEAGKLGKLVGDKLNDAVEGSATKLDNEAKDILKAFFDALRPELDVVGVDA